MDPIRFAIENPVKIAVGVILILLFGLLSLAVIPVQLTPNVDEPVVAVTTRWEGASPQEIEADVVREQEDVLKTIQGLDKMTSVSQQGEGQILLEFPVGTDKDAALREVSEKLRQVPDYPENVDEPEVEASDPRNRDYIAWVIFTTTDPDFDIRQLQKWAEDQIQTRLERVPGVSEINVLGGSEPEVQVQIDPTRLAQQGITPTQFVAALRAQNANISAGDLDEGKKAVRLRAVGEYANLDEIRRTIISPPDAPVVRVHDVADVVLTYKEPVSAVRSTGQLALAINAQREVGTNVMQVMDAFKAAVADINQHVLPEKAKELGLDGTLQLEQVYDQTVYITSAIDLVYQNLWVGGVLAVFVLLSFLRSVRFTAVVALAIPISVIGTFVAMVGMGRNINVISLAGLAFAVGMVIDNAIVVLENIDRHRRSLHERAERAAYSGAKEVWGAILASTLTTLAVFIPVLTVQEEAGQLFRDISLAICAAVTLSLLVSVLVIPVASSRLLRGMDAGRGSNGSGGDAKRPKRAGRGPRQAIQSLFGLVPLAAWCNERLTRILYALLGSWTARLTIVGALVLAALVGARLLMPPTSYLPSGNRNIVFALLIPPPGYNLDQMQAVGKRVESVVRPFWEAEDDPDAAAQLPEIPAMDPATGQVNMIQPPPVSNFFFVGLNTGLMFSGAISADPDRVQPVGQLLNHAIGQQPGIIGFAQQQPLIRTGGGTGNSINLEISGDDLDEVKRAAGALFGMILQRWGPQAVRPDPGNFNLPGEELQVRRRPVRASELAVSQQDLGLFTRMLGDGAIIDDYTYRGDSIDLSVIRRAEPDDFRALGDMPLATDAGRVVPLAAVAEVVRTTAPQQINRIERQRAVTLEISLPDEVPLDSAMTVIRDQMIAPLRDQGVIAPLVNTNLAGTAAKLTSVQEAMLGEWTGFNFDSISSLAMSRAFLALLVVYLLMCALFESWLYPFVIMFTVPLAAFGGFVGLALVHFFIPAQQLDVLTMLGFVILIGIVVNNAILIVHQALNFMRGIGEVEGMEPGTRLEPRRAIAESTRTRVRPIFMSTLTSVGGMLPLVLFPGAGSELYRGLGGVVVGGLLCSAVLTPLIVPLALSMAIDLRQGLANLFTRSGQPETQAAQPEPTIAVGAQE